MAGSAACTAPSMRCSGSLSARSGTRRSLWIGSTRPTVASTDTCPRPGRYSGASYVVFGEPPPVEAAPADPNPQLPCKGSACRVRIKCSLPPGLAAACTNRVDVFVRADAARLLDNTSAPCVNNLAQLLKATNRLQEAEPLSRRHVEISLDFTCRTGHPHPHLNAALANYAGILRDLRRSKAEIQAELGALLRQYKVTLGRWRCALAAARLARPALPVAAGPTLPRSGQ